jgi:hypothetical protein
VTRSSIDRLFSYWQNADGDVSLDLNALGMGGGVVQSVSLLQGETYTLSWALAGNPEGQGPAIKQMQARAGAALSPLFAFDVTGRNRLNMGWTTVSWTFVHSEPTGPVQIELYSTLGVTDAGPAIDDVQLAGPSAACDDIDFNNNDVFPEDQDVIDFFNVLAGAECAACNDIDFNNNGVFPEDQDVIDFFNVLAGGSCP